MKMVRLSAGVDSKVRCLDIRLERGCYVFFQVEDAAFNALMSNTIVIGGSPVRTIKASVEIVL